MSRQHSPHERFKPIVTSLGWGGVAPFVLLLLSTLLDAPPQLETLLITYGLLILAFLCGTLWMEQILSTPPEARQLIASNLVVLVAWPAVLLPPPAATALLAAGFVLHLGLDTPWKKPNLPAWYARLRLHLSVVVTALLVLATLVGAIDGAR